MCDRLHLDAAIARGTGMAYFSRNQSSIERGGKIVADLFVLLILGAFCIAFFGFLGGIVAVVILEAALLGVDTLMPSDDDAHGAGVR